MFWQKMGWMELHCDSAGPEIAETLVPASAVAGIGMQVVLMKGCGRKFFGFYRELTAVSQRWVVRSEKRGKMEMVLLVQTSEQKKLPAGCVRCPDHRAAEHVADSSGLVVLASVVVGPEQLHYGLGEKDQQGLRLPAGLVAFYG